VTDWMDDQLSSWLVIDTINQNRVLHVVVLSIHCVWVMCVLRHKAITLKATDTHTYTHTQLHKCVCESVSSSINRLYVS